ncbi:copper/zinc superoxide dismutase [Acanthamoeba castellanii str. Neff]|uniref:Superoxide dismutase copper chaperone n=1 Tax=Acanthamoeba castellanii (strain ATCC 30010 / Neff) TaxID=1257118 RepID=L8HCY2_ACACF|nr:copper/zinc superoxide dismutase [Acanthamoeba castellanii str. Neff]ELR23077.1 copper/zinc superoxide dismutase [Acanthamoeba castellanii str. Neff]
MEGTQGSEKLRTGVKAQLNVEMTCQSCVEGITTALKAVPGVTVLDVDLDRGEVELLTQRVPVEKLLRILRETGRSASLQGLGGEGEQLGSAVSQLEPADGSKEGPHATVALDRCLVEAILDGFPPGEYDLAVHEFGDLSDAERSVGDVFGRHPGYADKPAGEIGRIAVGQNGEGTIMADNKQLKVWDIIGRSVVARPASPGGARGVAFGVIARSAGVRENPKKICRCDDPDF